MKNLKVCDLIYIFIIASICGWFMEGLWSLIIYHTFINHSAVVIGPFNMAYGICAVLLTVILIKYQNSSYPKLFFIGFVGGSIIEYIMSLGMEVFLGFTAWDYSQRFLNINGRICFLYSLFWGLLGIFWIKICYPYIMKLIKKIKPKLKEKLAVYIVIFLMFDILITLSAIKRARAFEKGIEPQNQYEKILDKTFNSKYLKNMFNNNWRS